MPYFKPITSLINKEIFRSIDDEKITLKFFTLLNELNKILDNDEFTNKQLKREYVRAVIEDKFQSDREFRLLVLRLRTQARKEFLKAIQREQDSLWVYYLIMVEIDIVSCSNDNNRLAGFR
ncbi:TPA: hypothetical protein ACN35L_002962 [Vibrio parahaemolyticus]